MARVARASQAPVVSNKMSNWTDLSVDKCPPVDIKPVDMVDTRKPVVKDVAYWRERKHIQRERQKLTAQSSAA